MSKIRRRCNGARFACPAGLDDHLALLTRVIGQCQRHLLDSASVRMLATLDVGDRVRVNRHVRPLYLQGPPAPSRAEPAAA